MIDTSIFSGRCDLYDTIEIFGVEKILSKYKIYDQRHILPLEVKEPKDLIPYYPYLVATMFSTKEDGGTIYLSSESYVNISEREYIQYDLDILLKYWRKCKRKKELFDKEKALKSIVLFFNDEYKIQLVDRVAEIGDKATIDNLHNRMHDGMRKDLFDEMIKNGWNEDKAGTWVYGWRRWYKEIKRE